MVANIVRGCCDKLQGRDANRKLQRAIKAGKIRDRMPAMLDQMAAALDDWLESEGRPFMYDDKDYQVDQQIDPQNSRSLSYASSPSSCFRSMLKISSWANCIVWC